MTIDLIICVCVCVCEMFDRSDTVRLFRCDFPLNNLQSVKTFYDRKAKTISFCCCSVGIPFGNTSYRMCMCETVCIFNLQFLLSFFNLVLFHLFFFVPFFCCLNGIIHSFGKVVQRSRADFSFFLSFVSI